MRNSEAAVEGERLSLEVQRVKREIELAKTAARATSGASWRCGRSSSAAATAPSRAPWTRRTRPTERRYRAASGSNAGMISRAKSSTVRDASSNVMSPNARSAQK